MKIKADLKQFVNDKLESEDMMNKIAENLIKQIKKMNLSKEILLSLNFKDLFENLFNKLNRQDENEVYLILEIIIENCTNLDSSKSHLLWLCVEKDKSLLDAINYIDSFNFQMAQYFDESIF